MERGFNEDISNSNDSPTEDAKDVSNSDYSSIEDAKGGVSNFDDTPIKDAKNEVSNSDYSKDANDEDVSNSDDSSIEDAKGGSNLDDTPFKDAKDEVSNSDYSKDVNDEDVANSDDSSIKDAKCSVSNLDDTPIKDAKDEVSNSDYSKDASDEDVSNSDDCNSDASTVKYETDEELLNYEQQMILYAKQKSLQEELEKSKQELFSFRKYVEESVVRNRHLLDWDISPIGSPNHDFPDPSILRGSLRYHDTELSDNLEDISKRSKDISETLATMETEVNQYESNLTLETSNKETPESGAGNESRDIFTAPPDLKTTESRERSNGRNSGKGKEAANKLYRYKKRSKTVSSSESLEKNTPITRSEHVFNIPESETPQNQQNKSPNEGISRISPAEKRKLSDSHEINLDRRQVDERYAGTSRFSQVFENRADDCGVSKTTKKLKCKAEETSEKFPLIKSLLSKNLPPSSGLSTKGDFASTSKESTLNRGTYFPLFEEGESSHMSEADGSLFKKEESSHMSEADCSLFKKEESSQMSVTDEDRLNEGGESPFHKIISEDDRLSDKGEQTLTDVSDVQPSERGESSLINDSETEHSKWGESPLRSVTKDSSFSQNDEPQE